MRFFGKQFSSTTHQILRIVFPCMILLVLALLTATFALTMAVSFFSTPSGYVDSFSIGLAPAPCTHEEYELCVFVYTFKTPSAQWIAVNSAAFGIISLLLFCSLRTCCGRYQSCGKLCCQIMACNFADDVWFESPAKPDGDVVACQTV